MMVKKIILPTKEEDVATTKAALSDPDNLPTTEADISAGKLRRVRGKQKALTKESVTIRIDRDALEKLRSYGKGWQTCLNAKLREMEGL